MQDVPQIGLYKHSPLQSFQPFLAFVLALADNNRIFMTATAAAYKCFLFPFHASRKVKVKTCYTDSDERLNKPRLLCLAVAREASREWKNKTNIK